MDTWKLVPEHGEEEKLLRIQTPKANYYYCREKQCSFKMRFLKEQKQLYKAGEHNHEQVGQTAAKQTLPPEYKLLGKFKADDPIWADVRQHTKTKFGSFFQCKKSKSKKCRFRVFWAKDGQLWKKGTHNHRLDGKGGGGGGGGKAPDNANAENAHAIVANANEAIVHPLEGGEEAAEGEAEAAQANEADEEEEGEQRGNVKAEPGTGDTPPVFRLAELIEPLRKVAQEFGASFRLEESPVGPAFTCSIILSRAGQSIELLDKEQTVRVSGEGWAESLVKTYQSKQFILAVKGLCHEKFGPRNATKNE